MRVLEPRGEEAVDCYPWYPPPVAIACALRVRRRQGSSHVAEEQTSHMEETSHHWLAALGDSPRIDLLI